MASGACAGAELSVGVVFEGVVVLGFVLRGLDFERSRGGMMVYFVVMRVCGLLDESEEREERRTVEGRAWRRRVDCVSHCWAVSRYGILRIGCASCGYEARV